MADLRSYFMADDGSHCRVCGGVTTDQFDVDLRRCSHCGVYHAALEIQMDMARFFYRMMFVWPVVFVACVGSALFDLWSGSWGMLISIATAVWSWYNFQRARADAAMYIAFKRNGYGGMEDSK